ncbi:MAG: MotA/TolQ/ExbB proton channel family protein [bacterium]
MNRTRIRSIATRSKKWQHWVLTISCLLLALSLSTGQVFSQRSKGRTRVEAKIQQANAKADSAKVAEEKNLSAWDIIEMTSWLFWPFVLLTSAGVMLLTLKSLQEYQEKTRAFPLLEKRIGSRDLKELVRKVQAGQQSRALRLMYAIIATFNKTNKAEPIGDDINTYLNTERESFETFHRIMGFLSDTAGALGLLGTVWGIFVTFHSGKMDGPTILQGMSVSLVTTLVGLVISLVLNAGATSVFSLFNKQLNLLATRAEELRQALLFVENRQPNAARAARTVNNASHFVRKPQHIPDEVFRANDNTPAKFSGTDGDFGQAAVPADYEENGNGWL